MNQENPLARLRWWFSAKPAALRHILATNVSVYLLLLFTGLLGFETLGRMLALNPDPQEVIFRPWQILTYSVVHLPERGFLFGLIHLAFNMFWLVWVGEEYEQLFGTGRLATLYLGSAVAGAALVLAMYPLAPEAAILAGPVYGASAAVLGVVTSVAMHFPDKHIGLLLFGMMRLRTALIIFLALDVLLGLGGGTFFVTHLGGVLFAIGYTRLNTRGAPSKSRRDTKPADLERAGVLDTLEHWLSGRRARMEAPVVEETDAAKPPEHEVDRILDKISECGYDSLTDAEKRALYEASKR